MMELPSASCRGNLCVLNIYLCFTCAFYDIHRKLIVFHFQERSYFAIRYMDIIRLEKRVFFHPKFYILHYNTEHVFFHRMYK